MHVFGMEEGGGDGPEYPEKAHGKNMQILHRKSAAQIQTHDPCTVRRTSFIKLSLVSFVSFNVLGSAMCSKLQRNLFVCMPSVWHINRQNKQRESKQREATEKRKGTQAKKEKRPRGTWGGVWRGGGIQTRTHFLFMDHKQP